MPRIAYVNGRYLPLAEAQVHVEDRGFQFADGVYEVIGVREGRFVDFTGHMDRLFRSLRELRIEPPMSRRALEHVIQETARRNPLPNAKIYIQVTRGQAPRDFRFPLEARPSLVVTVRPHAFTARERAEEPVPLPAGVRVVSTPDLRWKRCDIKTVALLPQVLAKQTAAEQGAFEAVMVDEAGHVTEGASANFWIVTREGLCKTRPVGPDILQGVTRTSLLALIARAGLQVRHGAFGLSDVRAAAEAFLTSATAFVTPVVEIDGHPIGTGQPGPVVRRLHQLYLDYAEGAHGGDQRWTYAEGEGRIG